MGWWWGRGGWGRMGGGSMEPGWSRQEVESVWGEMLRRLSSHG